MLKTHIKEMIYHTSIVLLTIAALIAGILVSYDLGTVLLRYVIVITVLKYIATTLLGFAVFLSAILLLQAILFDGE